MLSVNTDKRRKLTPEPDLLKSIMNEKLQTGTTLKEEKLWLHGKFFSTTLSGTEPPINRVRGSFFLLFGMMTPLISLPFLVGIRTFYYYSCTSSLEAGNHIPAAYFLQQKLLLFCLTSLIDMNRNQIYFKKEKDAFDVKKSKPQKHGTLVTIRVICF